MRPIHLLPLCVTLAACEAPLAETLNLMEPKFLLREGSSPPGTVIETTSTLSMRDGEMVVRGVRMKVSMEIREMLSLKLLSESDLERTALESRTRMTFTVLGETESEDETDALEGVTLVGQKAGGTIAWRLKEGLPTEAQREAIAGIPASSSYLPGPVALGETWGIDAEDILGGTSGALASTSGSTGGNGDMTFSALSEYRGIPCAELEFVIQDATFTPVEGSEDPPMTVDLRGTTCVALDSGVELRHSAEGWFSSGMPVDAEDKAADTRMLGVVEIVSDTTIRSTNDAIMLSTR